MIENILSKDFIEKQSNLFDVSGEMQSDLIKFLSVGRFCEAKNFDNVPEIASLIKAKGIDFKWYIIGYGSDEALIKSKIAEYNISDTVIILGKKIILIHILKRAIFMFSLRGTRENAWLSEKHRYWTSRW